jgi:hypothetical protein
MNNIEFKAALITAAIICFGLIATLAIYKIVTNFTLIGIVTFLGVAGSGVFVYFVYKIVLSRLIYEQNNPKM